MWLLSVVGGHDTNVLISLGQQVRSGFPVLELEIPTPGCWDVGL